MEILCFNAVQITGGLDVASNALSQIISRLRANIFEREGAPATFLPVLPYIPVSLDMSDGSKYGNKDGQPRNRGYSSYSGGYSSGDLSASDSYGIYSGSLVSLSWDPFTNISLQRCVSILLLGFIWLFWVLSKVQYLHVRMIHQLHISDGLHA